MIQSEEDILISSPLKRTTELDINTGKPKGKSSTRVYFKDSDRGLAYGFHYERRHILECLDIKTGDRVWQKRINSDYGMRTMKYIDDTTAVFLAAGIEVL